MIRHPLDTSFRDRVEHAIARDEDGSGPIRRRLAPETVLALDRLRLRLEERGDAPSDNPEVVRTPREAA